MNDSLNYQILDSNYEEEGKFFVTFYTSENKSIGLVLNDEDDEKRLSLWLTEAQKKRKQLLPFL